jgi:hydrogenase nickel incorporation protein HypA/HybF
MHELSIALSIVEIVSEEYGRHAPCRVEAVHLRLGALSGVAKDALLFSWDLACQETAVAGARLAVEEVAGTELQVTGMEIEDGSP